MSGIPKESDWCEQCGEHKLAHGKTEEKVANLNRITDHEFKGTCTHSNVEFVPYHTSYCPDCKTMVIEVMEVEGSSGPQPEFPLPGLVTANVKEPKIEFKYGNCKICETPLTEEYEHVSFCGDCADNTWQIITSGNKGEGNLPN